ncbi:hypothetical protein [Aneurinibacillus aneurinilyticus]|uniref:hypothetical protein n=1 Tax=Aneurinibacillus aneurinilyticus TaxID=1391 RepID=UPI003F9A4FE1
MQRLQFAYKKRGSRNIKLLRGVSAERMWNAKYDEREAIPKRKMFLQNVCGMRRV